MNKSVLDIQSQSMRDELSFSGIPEQQEKVPKVKIHEFLQQKLNILADQVKKHHLYWVHLLEAPGGSVRAWSGLLQGGGVPLGPQVPGAHDWFHFRVAGCR